MPLDKKNFCCRIAFLTYYVRFFFSEADVYFGLFFTVENMFISYLFILSKFFTPEYIIQNNKVFLINNLFITIKGSPRL